MPVLGGLFPDNVVTACCDARTSVAELLPEEAAFVATAVPKRQLEFAAARGCARQLLGRLGITGFALLSAPTREPIWPVGIVGSISHTDGMCAVVAAAARYYAGIGIDIEPAQSLPADIVARVCLPEESTASNPPAGLDAGVAQRLCFSAKEAVFKCQFPLTRSFLEFHDVAIAFDAEGRFHTRVLPSVPQLGGGERIHGRWACRDGYLLTGAWLERLPAADWLRCLSSSSPEPSR